MFKNIYIFQLKMFGRAWLLLLFTSVNSCPHLRMQSSQGHVQHREGFCPPPPTCQGLGTVLTSWDSQFSLAEPPTFENPELETVSQVAGSLLVLACDVSGVPMPVVTWLKDRMPVGEFCFSDLFSA